MTSHILLESSTSQLKGTQKLWLPCEIEALSIGSGVRHFGPYIVQSKKVTEVLTDNKPCVEAYGKLKQGLFSASARVTTFISTISRYGVKLSHIAGQKNILSDYLSRNPMVCDGNCQVCSFVEKSSLSVVQEVHISDVLSGSCAVPYTTRSTWYQSQQDCHILAQVSKYLAEGRAPPKKKKGMKEIKRYLNVVKLSSSPNDGLLVVPQEVALGRARQRIVVPRDILDGLLMSLHLQLQHPTKHQLKQIFHRGFFALDADEAIGRTIESCHTCAALKKVPTRFKSQSTTVPVDEGIGRRYSADVIKRERQLILLLREYISSYSDACFIKTESAESLHEGLLRLMARFRAPSGPPVIVRVDPGKGFESLASRMGLSQFHISLEVGAPKNPNKNPVAEKGISELHAEVARILPTGGPLDEVVLSTAVSNMNSRIRQSGLAASEVWNQRDMYTGDQLPIQDLQIIRDKAASRKNSHLSSAKHQARGLVSESFMKVSPGDIVYLYQDRDKTRSRSRYIVEKTAGNKSYIRKFVGNQLRSKLYEVANSDIIKVQAHIFPRVLSNDEDEYSEYGTEPEVEYIEDSTVNTDDDTEYDESIYSDGGELSGSEEDVHKNEEVGSEEDVYENEEVREEVEIRLADDEQNLAAEEPEPVENAEEEFVDAVGAQADVEVPQVDIELRRSGRMRKQPVHLKPYFTGKRLSDVVLEILSVIFCKWTR